MVKAVGGVRVAALDVGALFGGVELHHRVPVQPVGVAEIAGTETDPHDRMARRPVPPVVHGEAPEQFLASLEQLLQRVHEQALAETPRARQEIVLAFRGQPFSVGCLVDIVMAFFADLAEGLDADGQLAFHRAAS